MASSKPRALCVLSDHRPEGFGDVLTLLSKTPFEWHFVVESDNAKTGHPLLSQLPGWLEPVGYYDQPFLQHSRALHQYVHELQPDVCWIIGQTSLALVPLQARATGIGLAGCRWLLTPHPQPGVEGAFPEALLEGFAARQAAELADDLVRQPDEIAAGLESAKAGKKKTPGRKPETPRVSVCIAHYNYGRFLREQLHSLRAQSWPNFEVIVVDDGSTDPESLEIWKSLPETFADATFHFHRREKNLGLAATRNEAAERASGDWIVFCDADNRSHPRMLESMVNAALRTGADIVTCYARQFSVAGDGVETTLEYYTPLGPCLELGWLFNLFGDANALIHKSAFFAAGGVQAVSGTAAEDWVLYARMIWSGAKLAVVPEVLFDYRHHDGSLMRTRSWDKSLNQLRDVYREQIARLPEDLRKHWSPLFDALPHFHHWREQAADLWKQNREVWKIKTAQDAEVARLQKLASDQSEQICQQADEIRDIWEKFQQATSEFQKQHEESDSFFKEQLTARDQQLAEMHKLFDGFNGKLAELWQSRQEMDKWYQQLIAQQKDEHRDQIARIAGETEAQIKQHQTAIEELTRKLEHLCKPWWKRWLKS